MLRSPARQVTRYASFGTFWISSFRPATTSRPRYLSTFRTRPPSLIRTSPHLLPNLSPFFAARLSTLPGGSRDARLARVKESYSSITTELIDEFKRMGMPEEVTTWYKNSLDYNVFQGQLNRVMAVIDAVEIIKRRSLSDDEYLQAATLGWAVDLVMVYIIVADDIMDASLTRRDLPCWYRKPEVGMFAVNDACMLLSTTFHLLKLHFRNEPCYLNLLELFLEATRQAEIGQLIDAATTFKDVDLNKFSFDLYWLTATWKAGYPYYLLVASAMHMCGVSDAPVIPSLDASKPPESPYVLTRNILLLFGKYAQAQNDYLDFAITPGDTRKIGTDIINNKGSWCINTALVNATPEQRRTLEEHYGRGPSGGASEMKVRAVFEEIGVRDKFYHYEKEAVESIRAQIARIPQVEQENVLRREVFENFLGSHHRAT